MCALEDCSKGGALSSGTNLGGSPWNDPQVRGERSENLTLFADWQYVLTTMFIAVRIQCAFFIPVGQIDEAWAFAKENKGGADVFKHPNTGCMHDDHSARAVWD